jgi:hypothetical protein
MPQKIRLIPDRKTLKTRADHYKAQMEQAQREKQAIGLFLAALIHERGGSWFVSEKALQALPPMNLNKRKDTVLNGWQFTLEYGPATLAAVEPAPAPPENSLDTPA